LDGLPTVERSAMNDSTEVKFIKAERISLKTHPKLDEKWVQKADRKRAVDPWTRRRLR
jgi:hypothetical protein